ncbi:hypothetical protein D8771_20035 [Streptomyces albus]|uniref:Uncharacterized protein n=1 Tax=Streptomyces albus TaxID=1888 RepID=A0A8H1LA06_9ACTN|nr:hypothetical protein D8771_20035 [Streptomyces albus]
MDRWREGRAERVRAARQRRLAKRSMRRALRSSRLRYWGRCLGAAVLAAPVGVLGLVTTPLGRRLGWPGLMHPGRRLFRLLTGKARATREERDALARAMFETADQDERDAADLLTRVPRAPRNHHLLLTGDAMSDTPGFLFDASASEMEEAANSYDPSGAMHVVNTLLGMPTALTSIANTFKILAEKSDEDFPLEKEVAEALEEVYKHLKRSVEAAEEVAEVVERVHEHDIRRHKEPRKGEPMWDTSNNDD